MDFFLCFFVLYSLLSLAPSPFYLLSFFVIWEIYYGWIGSYYRHLTLVWQEEGKMDGWMDGKGIIKIISLLLPACLLVLLCSDVFWVSE